MADGPKELSVHLADDVLELSHAADLLVQKLRSDRRFAQCAVSLDSPEAAEQARGFLGCLLGASLDGFGSQPRSTCRLTAASLSGSPFDGLVGALLDAVRRPLPLGRDVLTVALTSLLREDDPRVLVFQRHLASTSVVRGDSLEELPELIGPAGAPDALHQNGSTLAHAALSSNSRLITASGSNTMLGTDAPEDGINVHSLEQLSLEPDEVWEVRSTWQAFCAAAASHEAAGEMIYGAIFEGAPSLQALFTTPRALQAMKFMNGLQGFVSALDEPSKLKVLVEGLGFGHLHLDVTIPRVLIFRDAILDLLDVELGVRFTMTAREGWKQLLNYIGGAIIFVKAHYSARLSVLLQSWALANDQTATATTHKDVETQDTSSSLGTREQVEEVKDVEASAGAKQESRWAAMRQIRKRGVSSTGHENGIDSGEHAAHNGNGNLLSAQTVPTTYAEMFEINAAVMGFSKSVWLREVVLSFDAIVRNVANSARLQEECDVLALRISKCTSSAVNLAEYKSCMLAALRSLLPKVWDSSYEVAWTWLWENVERLLLKTLGRPPAWEAALTGLVRSLEENQKRAIPQKIYDRFFELAPAGQDYFKQSNTRLLFISERIMEMTCEIFRDPWRSVEEISGIGLRHVGYGIPTELVGPFVTASIEVMCTATESQEVMEAYRWSLGLISKILVRTISEGSTIVMKAINANSTRMLKKAVSCAPRRDRAEWLLNIQVGTQKISPLEWAIESGSLEAADAAIRDLLTLRADRDIYYYGVDELFKRHPDFVQRLCDFAPTLLPTLLEGLVWRSHQTQNGMRRVNYYVKHLIIDKEGGRSDALKAIASSGDQTIISHPVIVLVSDTLWTGVIRRQFVLSKIGFLVSVLVFMLSQAILPKTRVEENRGIRIAIFTGRIVTYVFSLGRLVFSHSRRTLRGYYRGDVIRVCHIPFPGYLSDPFMALGMLMMVLLIGMCAHEPMFYCIGSISAWPTEVCPRAEDIYLRYAVFSSTAMVIHWLLLVDMAAFSTKLQAFLLVCRHVMGELGRFLVAMLFLLATFSSAITCLRHSKDEFSDLPSAANCLVAITVGLYEGDYREMTHEPALLFPVLLFVTVSTILLINLLIAQLNCSYEYVYQDMVGFARLARAQLIVDMLASCPPSRWQRFISTLHLDQPIEFDEGDVGLAGGIQVKEPSSLHPVVVDSIHRFGGTCSPDMQWPEVAEEEDRFERVERLIQAAYKRVVKVRGGASGSSRNSGSLTGSRASGRSSKSASESSELSG